MAFQPFVAQGRRRKRLRSYYLGDAYGTDKGLLYQLRYEILDRIPKN